MNPKNLPDDLPDVRWHAVQTRDAAADGRFVYSVRTTGVYCRPSCPSRQARRENVAFHDDGAAAVRAGFRPCKRCAPDGPSPASQRAALAARLCQLLEEVEPTPDLQALADHVGLSPFHTHRLFKAATGTTPRAWAAASRARRVRAALQSPTTAEDTVTNAIHDAGYGSAARFYERADALLGMSPTAFKRGGTATTIRFAIGACSLGAILVAATEKGVCAILLGDDPEALAHDLERRFPRAELVGGDADFEEVVARVVGFVEEPARAAALPLDLRGTAFQQRVWDALTRIPAGTTTSYAALAAAVGAPKAARAVAAACAANPLAVAIPCHRVVRTDGGLSGYRWGVERKRALLDREATGA